MAFEVEQTNDVVRTASVHINYQAYEAGVTRALRKLANRAKIRGFRKGKIPLNVLRQHYGQSVQSEVIEDLLRTSIDEIISELKTVLFVSEPQITSLPIAGDDFRFMVEVEVRPDIDPIGYKGIRIDRPAIVVDEADIDKELKLLRREHAKTSPSPIEGRNNIQKGDLVTFSFAAESDDPDLAYFRGEEAQVRVGDGLAMAGVEEALEGATFDAELVVHVTADDTFSVKDLRGRSFPVKINVQMVEAQALPELDDQFAKDTGEAETIEELRNLIRESLARSQEHDARHFAEDQLVGALLANHSFDLPPRYFELQLEDAVRQQLGQMGQMDEQQVQMLVPAMKESLRDKCEQEIRTEFIMLAIADKEGITVDNDDLRETIEHQAQHMGVEPLALLRYLNSDKDALYRMMTTARLEKTMAWIIDHATVSEISWEEARERRKQANAHAAAEAQVAESAPQVPKPVDAEAASDAGGQAETTPAQARKEADGYDADAAREAFNAMTVGDLKEICKDNDIKVSGKKDELIDRLIEAQVTA